jgi:ATP-binding cassette subfamily C protein CydD
MLNKQLLIQANIAQRHLLLIIGFAMGIGILAISQANFLSGIINAVFLQHQRLADVESPLGLLLAVIVFRALFGYFSELTAVRMAARVKNMLRERLFRHVLALGPHYLYGERTGELVNLLTEGIDALEAYFARYLPQLATAVLIPLTVLVWIFPIDLMSGLILLFTAPLIPLFMWLIGTWAEAVSHQRWVALSRMSAHFFDVLQGLATLKMFGRSREQIGIIRNVCDSFRGTTLEVLRVAFLSALTLELLTTLSTAVVAVTVGLRLLYGKLLFSQAFFLLLLAPEFYLPLRLLGSSFHAGLAGISAANRIFGVLAEVLPEEGGQEDDLPGQPGIDICLRNVSYAYAEGTGDALHNVSFTVAAGERVALAGPSGGGKSTVAHLLLRFIKADAGNLLINGLPLDRISIRRWRQLVSYIPQAPYLFYGTVAENIKMGQDKTGEEIVSAATAAGAHAFIARLPQGYDTYIGDGGISLSGGQRQLLAIARAFLQNSPVLIIDEPTSGLDLLSEQAVIAALERLMTGRTTLIIAHRLATIRYMDKIMLLDHGQVVEMGSPRELMVLNGRYRQLIDAYRGVL